MYEDVLVDFSGVLEYSGGPIAAGGGAESGTPDVPLRVVSEVKVRLDSLTELEIPGRKSKRFSLTHLHIF